MSECKIKSYNAIRAAIFGKPITKVQWLIGLRSKSHRHSEVQFSERYGNVSFSATYQDGCKCCRFKYIEYSHEKERWDTVIVPMTDEEEDRAWAEALKMAGYADTFMDNMSFGTRKKLHTIANYVSYGYNAIPYDLKGQLCHASKLKLWKPSKKKTWCSKAVASVLYSAKPDFYDFLNVHGMVDELRPDQLDTMARYYF